MAYDTGLSNRIREALSQVPGNIQEKEMFGGICFMLNDKMCVGVLKDEMMCRVGPAAYPGALEEPGCREMRFTGRPMTGYVFVTREAASNKKDLQRWIDLCVAFNAEAKAKPRKKRRSYLM
jgi:TfoX/Sxy family transcriptional regulator of competence genes